MLVLADRFVFYCNLLVKSVKLEDGGKNAFLPREKKMVTLFGPTNRIKTNLTLSLIDTRNMTHNDSVQRRWWRREGSDQVDVQDRECNYNKPLNQNEWTHVLNRLTSFVAVKAF